jgi:hypothetical protein
MQQHAFLAENLSAINAFTPLPIRCVAIRNELTRDGGKAGTNKLSHLAMQME